MPRGKNLWLAILALAMAAILAAQPSHQISPAELQKQFLRKFVAAAVERTHHVVRYDPGYVRIAYPGGDVPPDTGVCTDEVIRAYRAVGIDLQKEVHEDMAANFGAYPSQRLWGRTSPDANIDHRRVPNLMVFFSRKGEALPISTRASDLPARRFGYLGSGQRHDAHWHGCGPEGATEPPLHDRAQHRPGPKTGRRAFRLEDHRALQILWPSKFSCRSRKVSMN